MIPSRMLREEEYEIYCGYPKAFVDMVYDRYSIHHDPLSPIRHLSDIVNLLHGWK